jgi:hypothetical protein
MTQDIICLDVTVNGTLSPIPITKPVMMPSNKPHLNMLDLSGITGEQLTLRCPHPQTMRRDRCSAAQHARAADRFACEIGGFLKVIGSACGG